MELQLGTRHVSPAVGGPACTLQLLGQAHTLALMTLQVFKDNSQSTGLWLEPLADTGNSLLSDAWTKDSSGTAGSGRPSMLWWGCPSAMLLVSVLLQSAALWGYWPLSRSWSLPNVTLFDRKQPEGVPPQWSQWHS